MRFQRFVATALGVAAVSVACAPDGTPESAEAAPDGDVVAIIDGDPVTLPELDDWIRDALFERQVGSQAGSKQYEVRQQMLDEMIAERVLGSQAENQGITQEALIEQKVAELGPVSDEAVTAFFEEHKARFPADDTLERRDSQIRRYLESQREREALDAILASSDVQVRLEAPRFEIRAIGPSRGPENAPVTIVEFSDYQCPFCQRAEEVVEQILERYPTQVRVVFRHMPLDSIHPQARPAAEAAVCAEEQGRFWEYHAQLFANQRALSEENLADYAAEAGLEVASFNACLETDETQERVEADVQDGRALGISGTPAFFVNGIMLTGAKPVEEFVEVIERELQARTDSSAS